MGVHVKNFDLAGLHVDFHLATDRSLVPVDRADALSGFQIEAAAGTKCAPPDKVALATAQRNLAVAKRATGSAANRDSTLFENQIAHGRFEQLRGICERLSH